MSDAKSEPAPESVRTPITARPKFDPAKFARDSESILRAKEAPTVPPPPPADEGPEVAVVALDLDSASVLADEVPALAVPRSSLKWYELEPDTSALLLRVNGAATVAGIASGAGRAARTSQQSVRGACAKASDPLAVALGSFRPFFTVFAESDTGPGHSGRLRSRW